MAALHPAVVWLVVAAVVGVILLIASIVANRNDKKKKKGGSRQQERTENVGAVGGARRRTRLRDAQSRMNRRANYDDDDDDDDFEGGGGGDGFYMGLENQKPVGKMGTKKRQKLEMKEEARLQREQMEAEREDKKEREALREEERKRREARQQREKERLAEEERKRKEEQERREHEEYLMLKEQFTVDEEGVAETAEQSEALLEEFINYIKQTKVVLLEELACQFGLRTQDAIDRLQALQEMERITGVTDDRGKFIYISPEELEAVAKFIKQRGRVTISELAESSNTLINLLTDKSHTKTPPTTQVSA
ncbi:DDRGK domain-containing protein 1-like [Montipora foliosa]|uniref:DDRGK domain-containing protein 1-like n=1 Tax=Montipora foliosa TaxID=591990 RepID=UPI0035F1C453